MFYFVLQCLVITVILLVSLMVFIFYTCFLPLLLFHPTPYIVKPIEFTWWCMSLFTGDYISTSPNINPIFHYLFLILDLIIGHYLLLNIVFHYYCGVRTSPGNPPRVRT